MTQDPGPCPENRETPSEQPATGAAARGSPTRKTIEAYFEHGPGAASWDAGFYGIHGFLFGAATAAQPPLPETWLEALLPSPGVLEEQAQEVGLSAEALVRALTELYSEIHEQIHTQGEIELPEGCELYEPPQENFWPAPVGSWSRGLVYAWASFVSCAQRIIELSPNPQQALEPGPLEHGNLQGNIDWTVGQVIVYLRFFRDQAEIEHLISGANGSNDPKQELHELARDAHERFHVAVTALAWLKQMHRQSCEMINQSVGLNAEPLGPPQPARSGKIGRNEPCPCGSGRKYKRCCAGPRNG